MAKIRQLKEKSNLLKSVSCLKTLIIRALTIYICCFFVILKKAGYLKDVFSCIFCAL